MLDEEMDNMIRQATEQHHPSYDNKAWDKMEQLLDKHLPQKKDRKGFIFFLLLSLLIGGGLFVGGYYFIGNKKETAAKNEPKKELAQQSATPVTAPISDNGSTPVQNSSPVVNSNENATPVSEPAKQQVNTFAIGRTAAKTNMRITSGNTVTDDISKTTNSPATNKLQQKKKNSVTKEIATTINGSADKNIVTTDPKKSPVENKADVQQTAKRSADVVKDIPKEKAIETINTKTTASSEKKRSKQSIASNFGLSFSAGPDISFVELNKPGKVTLSYGIGLSYTFIKKLTLHTGFFVAKKIYSADSASYHAPGGFWSYYPNMENKIDANCKVYEVPVNLLYNFGQKKNHNWFAGAGVSSYFMKKETYDYSYSYGGQTYPKSYSIQNQNQHNFAVLTLTSGYQYNVSPRISVSAQPYVKLPLKGIGLGKVQLKGGGAMFNLTVKPFARRNKK